MIVLGFGSVPAMREAPVDTAVGGRAVKVAAVVIGAVLVLGVGGVALGQSVPQHPIGFAVVFILGTPARFGEITPLGVLLQALRDSWVGGGPRPLHLAGVDPCNFSRLVAARPVGHAARRKGG